MSASDSTATSAACQLPPIASADQSPTGLQRLLVALAALLALISPFLIDTQSNGSLGNELVGTGRVLVTQHPVPTSVSKEPSALLRAFTTDWFAQTQPGTELYRPIPTLLIGFGALVASSGQEFAYSLDQPGSSSLPFKLIATALKIVCALLVMELALALTHKRRVAFFAGLLFAVLPVHGATVFDIAGIATTSATAFMLGAWVLWLRAGERPISQPIWLGGAALCTLLAALSMETAFLLPFVIFAADIGRKGSGGLRDGLHHALGKLPSFAILGAALGLALVLRFLVTGQILPQYLPGSEVENPLITEGIVTRVLDGLRLAIGGLPVVFGINPFSTPHIGFSADYSAPQIALGNAFGLANLIGLAAWAAAIFGVVVLFKTCRTRGSLLLAALVSLLAAAHLLAPAGDVFNERLLFFPSAIFITFVASLAAPLLGRIGVAGTGVLGLVVVVLGFFTTRGAATYSEEGSLWRITSRESAVASTRAHFNYGRELLRRESTSSAASAFNTAIRPVASEPATKHSWARALLALAYLSSGENDRAVAPLKEALEIQIERAGGTWKKSKWDGYAREDRPDVLLWKLTEIEAIGGHDREGFLAYLDGLLAKGYASPYVYLRRAETLRQLGRHAEAEVAYRAGIAIDPLFSLVRSLGQYLRAQRRNGEAETLYQEELARLNADAKTSQVQRMEFLLLSAELAYDKGDDATTRRLLDEVMAYGPLGSLRFRALQMQATLLLDAPLNGTTAFDKEVEQFQRFDQAQNILREAIYGWPAQDDMTKLAWQTYATLLFELRRYRATTNFLGPIVGAADTATLRLYLGESQYWLADEANWAPGPATQARTNLGSAADQFRNLALRARDLDTGRSDGDQWLLANFYARARLLELRALRALGKLPEFEEQLAIEYERAQSELGSLITRLQIEIEQGRYNEAHATIAELNQRHPGGASQWNDYYGGALNELESRLVDVGGNPTPEALRHCAFIQFKLSDFSGAETAITKAITLAANDPVELAQCRRVAAEFIVQMRGAGDALKMVEDALRGLGDASPELKLELEQRRTALNAMLGRPLVAADATQG